MSHKNGLVDDGSDGWTDEPLRTREETPAYRPAPPLQPAAPVALPTPAPAATASAPAPTPEAPRPSVLRKPITGTPGPNNPAPLPSRYRT